MNTAGASVTSTWAAGLAILNRTREMSACLRKLSLNAAKNWVQNRGAKRRVVSRDIGSCLELNGLGLRARSLRDDNLGKRTIAKARRGSHDENDCRLVEPGPNR